MACTSTSHILSFADPINVSVQPGDILYKSPPTNQQAGRNHPGTFNQYGNSKPLAFGVVCASDHVNQQVWYDIIGSNTPPIVGTEYLYFSKDNRANTSGIIGYFAKTEFLNNSSFPAEIFATAVDYVESSK